MTRESGGRASLFLTICPFFTVFPALLLMLGALSDTVQRWCLGDADTAAGILRACRTWCVLMVGAAVLGVVLTLAVTLLAADALRKRGAAGMWTNLLKMAAIPLAVEVLLCGALLRSEVLPLLQRVGPDLRQIESGQLESREVWFLPGQASTHLPGAFGPEKDLVQYQVRDMDGEILIVYLPACWNFAPEGTYQASKDLDWNRENTLRYRLEVTSQFRLSTLVPEQLP